MSKYQPVFDLIKEIDQFLKDQPIAEDLDACDQFLRQLHALYGTVNTYAARMEIRFYEGFKEVINNPKLIDNWKMVKNSSTLSIAFVAGHYPEEYELWQKLKGYLGALRITSDNYRTLLSSFKEEKLLALRQQNQAKPK